MNLDLYKSVQGGNLDNLKQQLDVLIRNNNQIPHQITRTKNNLLHVLSQFGDFLECVVQIFDHIQDFEDQYSMLTWQNSLGETALHIASRNGHVKIVQAFCERAQSFDRDYLENGAQIVEKMMRAADQYGDTALHNAVKSKHIRVVQILVSVDPHFRHSANKMEETPLYLAVERSYHEIVDLILTSCSSPGYEGPDGKTALHAAVLDKCTECTTKLLGKNLTLTKQADESGRIPLHYAAYIRSEEVASKLLGADRSTAYTTVDKDDNKTALHIASLEGNKSVMKVLLEHCPDCWDMVTSKSQNVLHLATRGGYIYITAVDFILEQRWVVNLINQKDEDGNTPFHLLAKYASWMYPQFSSLVKDLPLDRNAVNKEGFTPPDLLMKLEYSKLLKYQILEQEVDSKLGCRNFVNERNESEANNDNEVDKKTKGSEDRQFLEELGKFAETQLIMATLIATVTFAAGFTLPGGYDGNEGPNQGMAVLVRKAAFKIFVVSDAVAVTSSLLSVFLHFAAAFYSTGKDDEKDEDEIPDEIGKLYGSAMMFLLIAMIGMVIAFITGLYTVLGDGSLGLAICVCCLGCFALVFIFYKLHRVWGMRKLLSYVWDELLEGWRGKGRGAWKLATKAFPF